MPSDRLEGVALVTGGGRGIGASIARELADAGMRVAVTGRTSAQVEAVASEIDGLALVGDVSHSDDVERWVSRTEAELGPIDLLAANAGIGNQDGATWEIPVDAWWHVLEVNVLGVAPLVPGRGPANARARSRAHRDHRQRRRLPARIAAHGVPDEQGRGLPLRGDARKRARGPHPGLLLQPRPRADGHDRADSATTRPGRRPSSRRSSFVFSHPAAPTRSPVATCMRSTTTSRISSGAPTRSSRTTSTRYGCAADVTRRERLHPLPCAGVPVFICPNCKERSIDLDGYDGFSMQAVQCKSCAFGFLYELLEDYYPAPETGFVVCDRDARVLAAGRGVFELTGFRDADLIGRDVTDALGLSDKAPIEVVQEWGVRKMGQELEIRTRAGIEKRVVVDFFPAYDDDGGLLLALTPR